MKWETKRGMHAVEFNARQDDYSPWNKHRHEVVNSNADIQVKDYDGSIPANPEPWLHIQLTERYQNANGKRVMEKTIHVTLDEQQRAALLDILQGRDYSLVGNEKETNQ